MGICEAFVRKSFLVKVSPRQTLIPEHILMIFSELVLNHSGAGRNPKFLRVSWLPAFAGVTKTKAYGPQKKLEGHKHAYMTISH